MTRLPVLFLLTFVVPMVLASCDHYYEDDECTCPHGGTIGGWNNAEDTTIHQKDTTGGFDVSLENWQKTETRDISI